MLTTDYNERYALLTGENVILDANDEDQHEAMEISDNKRKSKEIEKEDSSKKSNRSSEGSEKGSKGSKKSEEAAEDDKKKYKALPYDAKKRKIMTCKLMFFFIMGMLYFYLVFFTGYESLEKILREMPEQVNWSNRRKQLVKGINQWTTESLINHQETIGYKYILPTYQFVGSPVLHAEEQIEELEFVENTVIYGNED